MGLTRARRTAAVTVTAALIAVGGAIAARGLLDRGARFDQPTLTDTQAHQVATGLATALDDLGARFLVADPSTERLQILHWDDDVDAAERRLAEHLDLVGGASAFVRASVAELERRGPGGVTSVETRVAEAAPIGLDESDADWVHVEIVQDETYDGGETSTSSTRYGVAVRAGAIVDVRHLDGVLAGSETASASVVRTFVTAVLAGDERTVERFSSEASDRELTTLRAWLAAAGDLDIAELPASTLGSLQVAYVVPQRGPLLRFEVTSSGAPRVTWDVVGGT